MKDNKNTHVRAEPIDGGYAVTVRECHFALSEKEAIQLADTIEILAMRRRQERMRKIVVSARHPDVLLPYEKKVE